MGLLSPLLDIQNIDRECDRLLQRRSELPERADRVRIEARIAAVDGVLESLVQERRRLDLAEHEMADQVAAVAARAKHVEDTMYGGTVTAAKDLSTLQNEIAAIRAQQAGLEDQEMALLEEIDGVEGEMAEQRRLRAEIEGELAETDARLKAAEGVIDDELAEFGRGKASHAERLPGAVIDAYEALRTNHRLGGIAAAVFTEKGCGGCRMQLPVLELRLMKDQPEDALLRCENCGRLLVR
jgi:predicted  nucleic acid-binding Zn-ribbon protein